ncbi:MAG: hypothetical protein KDC12_02130 [Flavobacteriales bacterium]|nr:hypothetical protein [Flavobacteriales bacterium]
MRIITFLAAVFCLFQANAQVDMNLFKDMRMRHIGPATMSGRVTSIDAVISDPNVIYVGTASGGLWKSESGGMTWTPVFDDQPLMSIGAVAIDQSNPSVVWAGTGEGNPRNSHTSGAGIYRSLDAGNSWEFMGLEETRVIHRVIVDPRDSKTVYVAAMGSPWGPNAERGVYRTRDGGKTWQNILFVDNGTGCADLVMDPSNPNKLFAAMWEYERKPWTFNSGGKGSGLYVSHDGGDTWQERTDDDGLPEGDLGRIGLAVAASNPKIVYALVEAKETALYKSSDGGFNWHKIGSENVGNRPFYYADIFVNPKDEKEVWSLWSMVSRSDDGGKSFDVVIPYSGVHPDHHAFWIHPDDPSLMMDGNDGGFNISRDGGTTWEYITNLPLGQFYHINYDMDIPYHVYGGMQDNGSWQGPAYVWTYDGIRNEDWKEISFGDGFDVVPFDGHGERAFSMWQGGNVTDTDIKTGDSRYIRPVHPDGDKLRFNWNAAIAQIPGEPCGLLFGSQYVHRTSDCGASWEIISPDLTTNDTLKLKQAESGGLTRDVTDAENHCTILCIAPSTLEKEVIWVGTDDGNVQVTQDGGDSWHNVTPNIKGVPAFAWVPQIEVSTHHPGEAFVVMNNYRQNDRGVYVYHTKDYGKKWLPIANSQQVNGHALCFVQDPVAENLLFLGTEHGLYMSFDYGRNWNAWKHNYPAVATIDMKIHPREDDLIIGTFGRAAYILDDISPLRQQAMGTYAQSDTLKIISIPDAYTVSYARPNGVRFPADHHWSGENRSSQARISYHARFEAKESRDKNEKIKIYVRNEAGDTLRHFSTRPDSTGVNLVTWNLRKDGVRYPSRRDVEKDADGPWGGREVIPGTYEILMVMGEHKDSAWVNVMSDPRGTFNPAIEQREEELFDEFSTVVNSAYTSFEWTKDALKTMDRVSSRFELVEDSLLKDLNTLGDSIRKEIRSIQDQFMLPQGTSGYHDESDLINTYLWQASSYLDGGHISPGNSANWAIQAAREKVEKAQGQIVQLRDGAWTEWKGLAETIESSPFKEEVELE